MKIFVSKLSQEHRFRKGFGSQHVEASRLGFESKWERFYHVLLSFSGKLIWKMSPLVLGEILGVFVKALTSNIKYPVQGCENLQLRNEMQLSVKRKLFLNFLLHFLNLHHILNILKEKMIVIVNVFPKLQTVKIFVSKLSQEHRFSTSFGSEHVEASQLLLKSPWECFYHVLLSYPGNWFGICLP